MTPAAKRALFWSATLLSPVAALVCVELLLRLTGLFAPEPLFLDVPESHGAVRKFNPWVSRRYFDSTQASLPALAPELFTVIKPASTFRVLCLGESTTAGFPFEANVPFPAQLREILARAYPRRRVEVLNAGISAVSSFVVVDLLPDLLEEIRPDVVVVYLGHNEFYGVFGSASTLFPARKRLLVSAMLRLEHLHTVQMLKRLVQAFTPRPAPAAGDRSLMQAVVGNQDVVYHSPEYRNTMESFRANLESIAALCSDRGIPVVLGSLVSNWADQPPFQSARPNTADSARLAASLAAGSALLAAGDPPGAEARFREALAADSSNADAWFGAGRARLALHDSAGALAWLLGAKDRDAMRFRATEEANDIIRETAEKRGLRFIDLVKAFQDASPGRLIGNSLMCDHLHPSPRGYALMARAFYQGIASLPPLPPADQAFVPPDSPCGVTDLDWEIGLVKIFPMIHTWPFKQVRVTRADFRPHGDTAATRIAASYLRDQFAWTRAHDMLAHLYLERGSLEAARNEYRAVAVYLPDDPWPYQQLARLSEMESDWPARSAALREALARSSAKGLIAYQLALSEWKQGHLDKAMTAMDFAAGAPELKPEERENARFYLAGFLSDVGNRARARELLLAILKENRLVRPRTTVPHPA